jgi:hypothetical protein
MTKKAHYYLDVIIISAVVQLPHTTSISIVLVTRQGAIVSKYIIRYIALVRVVV